MIDEVTKQKIIDAANIVDVVSDFVSLRRSGADYIGLCPFHADRRPSFHVSPAKNICKCFACDAGGTPISFLMKLEKLSFTEALRYLAQKYGIPIEEHEESPEERAKRNQQESLYLIQKFAAEFFQKQLFEAEEGRSIALSYFRNRGVTDEIVAKFQLGYSPALSNALLTAATQAGYNPKYLYASGLCFEPKEGKSGGDRFRERIIFPVHTVSGRIVAFGGRIMKKSDKIAKYINSPESLIYSKSRELYGLYFAKKAIAQADKVFLVEGYMDVIAMHQVGIENVVASSGTALTREQIRLIARFSRNITVLYDGDAAGIKAAIRGVDLLLEAGMQVHVLLLPPGEDPDSFSRSQTREGFLRYIQQHEVDFISFKTELYKDEMASSPGRRAAVINDIVQSIALIPNTIERSVYSQSVAQELHIAEQTLLRQVKIARGNYYAGKTNEQRMLQRQEELARTRREEQRATLQDEEGDISPQSPQSPLEDPLRTIPLTPCEVSLLKILVRYGSKQIPIDNGDDSLSEMPLARYIYASFLPEDLTEETCTPLFLFFINEAEAGYTKDEAFKPERYLLNHENTFVADVALNLLSDKYQLSQTSKLALGIYNQDNSPELDVIINETLHAITAYKTEQTLQKIKRVQQQLSEAQAQGDNERVFALLQEITELNRTKKILAESLGGVAILPQS